MNSTHSTHYTQSNASLINKHQMQFSGSSCTLSLIRVVSETLQSLIEECKLLSLSRIIDYKDRTSFPFYYPQPPMISISKYIFHIVDNTQLGESTLVIALIYLDRLFRQHNVIIDEYSIHRLIIASVLLAIKYNEDLIYKQSFYARVAGVTKKELGLLESHMLKILNYELYVDGGIYESYQTYFDALMPQMKENFLLISKQFLCL